MCLGITLRKMILKSSPFIFAFLSVVCFTATTVRAEQYSTGSHTVSSAQGRLAINVGYVSHFNAHDFFVYSFIFQPKGSKEWHQVPRIEKADDPKMLFTLQTKHTPEMILFDAKVVSDKQKVQLITADREIGKTYANTGPVTLKRYELVKLEDDERWVFLRENTRTIAPKANVDSLLDNVVKPSKK